MQFIPRKQPTSSNGLLIVSLINESACSHWLFELTLFLPYCIFFSAFFFSLREKKLMSKASHIIAKMMVAEWTMSWRVSSLSLVFLVWHAGDGSSGEAAGEPAPTAESFLLHPRHCGPHRGRSGPWILAVLLRGGPGWGKTTDLYFRWKNKTTKKKLFLKFISLYLNLLCKKCCLWVIKLSTSASSTARFVFF